jgi:glycosyltransferase involved in cell wall biosynthesis
VLSIFPSFAVGGAQVRFSALANHHGRRWRHAIIAMDGRYDCAERLAPELDVSFPELATGRRAAVGDLWSFRRLLRTLRPDVLVTHNWGSIEWALSNQGPGSVRHVHIEDGFGADEAAGQFLRRVLARRAILRRSTVVVPSLTLAKIALEVWRLPKKTVRHIPNGLDLGRFHPVEAHGGVGPLNVGTVAALRPEKNLPRLLHATRLMLNRGVAARLTIVGDGPERARLEALAAQLGIDDALTFTGAIEDPAPIYRSFDVFALSSDTEQMPLSILEAMASGLPIAATGVGDVLQMVAPENHAFVCEQDEQALADALARLLSDRDLRLRTGGANHRKARSDYDQVAMFRRYGGLLSPSDYI